MLPPASLLLIGFIGLWLCRRRPRLGKRWVGVALGLLYVCSTSLFADCALSLLSPTYVDPFKHPNAQAIVTLAGGTYGYAPEYGADTVSSLTLVRLRYAATLYKRTGKPILVSGGSVSDKSTAEAQQMRAVLVEEFHVPVSWIEARSRDTFTNAIESHRILAPLGIKTIYLVTHAWHIPRARLAFEHAGFVVIAAPTGFKRVEDIGVYDLLPLRLSLVHAQSSDLNAPGD